GIVAEGMMIDAASFRADTVLAKHDETYMPKEVADKMGAAHRKHDVQMGSSAPAPAPGSTP
ncbi:MAG: cytochrome c maturation protein CcmE, partial [Stenotrophomonas sp.]